MVIRQGLRISTSRRRDFGALNSRRHWVFDTHTNTIETDETGASVDRVGKCVKGARTRCACADPRRRHFDCKNMNRNARPETPSAPFVLASAGAYAVMAWGPEQVRVVKAYVR
jgi:hypothetical protein